MHEHIDDDPHLEEYVKNGLAEFEAYLLKHARFDVFYAAWQLTHA